MAAIDFPNSPTPGQVFTVGNITWTYDATVGVWKGGSATASNLANGSAGTVPYQSAPNTTAMLSAGTVGLVLTSNGAAAPAWKPTETMFNDFLLMGA